ncbi:MAG: glycosyltransferase family 4 protein [Candidatus Sumerlaeia bacterium]
MTKKIGETDALENGPLRVMLDIRVLQGEDACKGMGHYTRGMVEALLRQAEEESIEYALALSRNYPDPDLPIPDYVRVMTISEPRQHAGWTQRIFRMTGSLTDWSWARMADARELQAMSRSFGADILHICCPLHGPFNWSIDPTVATVATLYDLIPYKYREMYLDQWPDFARRRYMHRLDMLRKLPLAFVISRAVAEDAEEYLNLSESQIALAYPGLRFDPEAKKPPPLPQRLDDPFVFAFYSRNPSKNSQTLVRAYAGLPGALRGKFPLKLACPDDPETRTELDDKISEAGLRGQVEVLEGLGDAELQEHYRKASLFVLPSKAEGFGLPALEAMCSGAPVLASNISVLREILDDAGSYFSPDDSDELAQKLRDLLEKPDLLEKMAESGLKRGKIFNWDKTARAMAADYRSLAKVS